MAVTLITGCQKTEHDDITPVSTPSTETTIKTSDATKETTATTIETISETTATTIIIDGYTFYDGMDLLYNNWIGMPVKIASYKAAKAFLCGDKDELESYFLVPEDADKYYFEQDLFNSLTYMSVAYADIYSETNVHIGYVLVRDEWDMLIYLEVYLVKSKDEWKVESIGLQG